MTRIAAIQMTSTDKLDENLKTAEKLLAQAAQNRAKVAVLPENFPIMTQDHAERMKIKENLGTGLIQQFLASQAKQHHMWIVGGTIPIAAKGEGRVRAACIVFNDKGEAVARYDKIHLFDVNVQGKETHQESQVIEPGESVVVVDSPIGKLGLAICYDVRFPELFRQLLTKGAEIFVLPSAFTVPTGQAHWEVLTRARAIENQCYLVAACQTGMHASGRQTYGHSLIVDPWGKILDCLPQNVGVITADIDLNYLQEIRTQMPVADHRKILSF